MDVCRGGRWGRQNEGRELNKGNIVSLQALIVILNKRTTPATQKCSPFF